MRENKKARGMAILPYYPSNIRIRSKSNLKSMINVSDLDLVVFRESQDKSVDEMLSSLREEFKGIKNISVLENSNKISRYFRLILGLLFFRPLTYQFYNKLFIKSALKKIDVSQYDYVFVERLPFNEWGLVHKKIIFDSVDCFSKQTKMFSKMKNLRSYLYKVDSLLLPMYESGVCNASSKVLVTTENEKASLLEIGVNKPIFVTCHVPQIPSMEVALNLTRPDIKDNSIVFHGKLSYSPNFEALKELDSIANELDKGVDVDVIGSVSAIKSNNFGNLNFKGYVDSLYTEISKHKLGVYPIQYCVGIQNKVLECLACGIPVLITNEIATSLDLDESILNRGIFVADINGFHESIVSIFSLLDKHDFSENCISYVDLILKDSQDTNIWHSIVYE